jgi:hypothetical protein
MEGIRFKPGQRVRCIDDLNRRGEIRRGETYKVASNQVFKGAYQRVIYLDGLKEPFSDTRFVSAQS